MSWVRKCAVDAADADADADADAGAVVVVVVDDDNEVIPRDCCEG